VAIGLRDSSWTIIGQKSNNDRTIHQNFEIKLKQGFELNVFTEHWKGTELSQNAKLFNECTVNPNSTGWGQSWPRQLWRPIPDKILIYQILLNDLILQKLLPNLFELLTWRKKITFWCPFWLFFVRSPAAETHCRPPPPFHLVLLWIQTTRGREKSRRAMVRSPEQYQSTFQSVSGCRPCRVREVMGSQSGPLFLSFLVYSWRHTFLGRFQNCSALWNYAKTGRDEFTPHKSEVKTKRTLVVNGHPGPWLI
jgi:hypothetical protein